MTPVELLDHAVEMAMQAFDVEIASWDLGVDLRGERALFEARVRERLAQTFQIVACDLADAREPKLRAWLATFPGHYIGGHAVVVAADETHALAHLAVRFIDAFPESLRHRTERLDRTLLAPVHLDTEGVSSFDNGDY